MEYAVVPNNFPPFRQIAALRLRRVTDAEIGKRIGGKIDLDAFIAGAIGLSGLGYAAPAQAQNGAAVNALSLDDLRDDGDIKIPDSRDDRGESYDEYSIDELAEERRDLAAAVKALNAAIPMTDDLDERDEIQEALTDADSAIAELKTAALAKGVDIDVYAGINTPAAPAAEGEAPQPAPAAGPTLVLDDTDGEFVMRAGDFIVEVPTRGLHLLSRGDLMAAAGAVPNFEFGADGFAETKFSADAKIFMVHGDMDVSIDIPDAYRPVRAGQPVTKLEDGEMILARDGQPPIVIESLSAFGWRRLIKDVASDECGPLVGDKLQDTVQMLMRLKSDGNTPQADAARARLHLEELGREWSHRQRPVVANGAGAPSREAIVESVKLAIGPVDEEIDAETRRKKRNIGGAVREYPTIDTLSAYLAAKGAPAGNMGRTAHSPVFSQMMGSPISESFRRFFKGYTDVALEDIALSQGNDALIAWAKQGERLAPSARVNFPGAPQYRASIDGVFAREGVELMIVRDPFASGYVYAWPSKAALKADLEARKAGAAELPEQTIDIAAGLPADNGMAAFFAEFAVPVAAEPAAAPAVVVRELVPGKDLERAAYLMSAPYLKDASLKRFAVECNGDLVAVAMAEGDETPVMLARVGEAADPAYLQAVIDFRNQPAPALPAPAM